MNDTLGHRLLASIAGDRLVILAGAGLSMALPSQVPSARYLARRCATDYERMTGAALPHECHESLERLAEYFLANNLFGPTFLDQLVPWELFRQSPNRGHFAIADFLAAGLVDLAVTTNFDWLVELAADSLGDHAFESSLCGTAANQCNRHKPFLKLHGCCVKDRRTTLWSATQLRSDPLRSRLEDSTSWLQAQLRERDLVFVGFWSDWSYLIQVLEDCVRNSEPRLVILVNPDDEATLREKAPRLWTWATNGKVEFIHVRESGDTFLEELRRHFSTRFLALLFEQGRAVGGAANGSAQDSDLLLPSTLTTEDLYALRRDAAGVPNHSIVRVKSVDKQMEQLGLVHILLQRAGAVWEGPRYVLQGRRLRVIQGAGQVLSSIRKQYSAEAPEPVGTDIVVCVGAMDDGEAPADLVRSGQESTIVRPGSSSQWLTLDRAREVLSI